MRCNVCTCPGKKTTGYKERDPRKRKAYLRLRERYLRRGKELVHVDESGFAPSVTRCYAYAPGGQRVSGLISGPRRPRTSLIAARIGKPFVAPLLFEGTCNTPLFNAWLGKALCPLLNDTHVVIRDHVPFQKSTQATALITSTGAKLLFLPPYSPDLNPIAHDFATIKKIREYNEHATLDHITQTYK
jgi:transposase